MHNDHLGIRMFQDILHSGYTLSLAQFLATMFTIALVYELYAQLIPLKMWGFVTAPMPTTVRWQSVNRVLCTLWASHTSALRALRQEIGCLCHRAPRRSAKHTFGAFGAIQQTTALCSPRKRRRRIFNTR